MKPDTLAQKIEIAFFIVLSYLALLFILAPIGFVTGDYRISCGLQAAFGGMIVAIMFFQNARRAERDTVNWLFIGLFSYLVPVAVYGFIFIKMTLPRALAAAPENRIVASLYMLVLFCPGSILGGLVAGAVHRMNLPWYWPKVQMALKKAIVLCVLSVGGLILALPLWWMLAVSLSTPGAAQTALASVETFEWIPNHPQWRNYVDALKKMGAARTAEETLITQIGENGEEIVQAAKVHYDPPATALVTGNIDPAWQGFFDSLANTVFITIVCVVGAILSCSLVGYSFARLRFRGNRALFLLMLATMMLPGQVTMIPVFILFRSLGWVDTFRPLTVPAFFGGAFFIFMYRQFFLQIPQDLIDSARIDGASYLSIWWRIMMPICRPVVAITAIFTFIGVWNDFMGPLIYLHSPEKGTLALALASFQGQFGGIQQVHLLMAGSVITMIPCIVLFFCAQRHFIKGLNLGAVKG